MKNTLESFGPLTQGYRRWRVIGKVAFVGFMASTLSMPLIRAYVPVLKDEHGNLAAIPALFFWLLALVSVGASKACAACNRCKVPLQSVRGTRSRKSEVLYCAQCGSYVDVTWL